MNTNIEKSFTFDSSRTSLDVRIGAQKVNLFDQKFAEGIKTSDGRTIREFKAANGIVVSVRKRDDHKLDLVFRAAGNAKDLGAFKFIVKPEVFSKVRQGDGDRTFRDSRTNPQPVTSKVEHDERKKALQNGYGLDTQKLEKPQKSEKKSLEEVDLLELYGREQSYQKTTDKSPANPKGLSEEVTKLGADLEELHIDLSKYKLTLQDLEAVHQLPKSYYDEDVINGLKRAILRKEGVAIHDYLQMVHEMVHDEFEDDEENTSTSSATNTAPQRREQNQKVQQSSIQREAKIFGEDIHSGWKNILNPEDLQGISKMADTGRPEHKFLKRELKNPPPRPKNMPFGYNFDETNVSNEVKAKRDKFVQETRDKLINDFIELAHGIKKPTNTSPNTGLKPDSSSEVRPRRVWFPQPDLLSQFDGQKQKTLPPEAKIKPDNAGIIPSVNVKKSNGNGIQQVDNLLDLAEIGKQTSQNVNFTKEKPTNTLPKSGNQSIFDQSIFDIFDVNFGGGNSLHEAGKSNQNQNVGPKPKDSIPQGQHTQAPEPKLFGTNKIHEGWQEILGTDGLKKYSGYIVYNGPGEKYLKETLEKEPLLGATETSLLEEYTRIQRERTKNTAPKPNAPIEIRPQVQALEPKLFDISKINEGWNAILTEEDRQGLASIADDNQQAVQYLKHQLEMPPNSGATRETLSAEYQRLKRDNQIVLLHREIHTLHQKVVAFEGDQYHSGDVQKIEERLSKLSGLVNQFLIDHAHPEVFQQFIKSAGNLLKSIEEEYTNLASPETRKAKQILSATKNFPEADLVSETLASLKTYEMFTESFISDFRKANKEGDESKQIDLLRNLTPPQIAIFEDNLTHITEQHLNKIGVGNLIDAKQYGDASLTALRQLGLTRDQSADNGHCFFESLSKQRQSAKAPKGDLQKNSDAKSEREDLINFFRDLTPDQAAIFKGPELAQIWESLNTGMDDRSTSSLGWGTSLHLSLKAMESDKPMIAITDKGRSAMVYNPDGSKSEYSLGDSGNNDGADDQNIQTLQALIANGAYVLEDTGKNHWNGTKNL